MKIKYLKAKHWLLMSMGGLLGITLGCERPDMYGCPCTIFRVKGVVVNEDGNPIEGIGVGSKPMTQTDPGGVVMPGIEYRDTTDSEGRFDVSYMDFPDRENIKVDFHDIDGEQNGSYALKEVNVSFQGAEFHNQSATREIEVTLQQYPSENN